MFNLDKKIIYVPFKSPHPALQSLFNKPPNNLKYIFNEKRIINLEESVINAKISKRNIYNNLKLVSKIVYHIKSFFEKISEKLKIPPLIIILPKRKLHYDYIWSRGLILGLKKYISYVDYIGGIVDFKDNILRSKISSIIRVWKNTRLSFLLPNFGFSILASATK